MGNEYCSTVSGIARREGDTDIVVGPPYESVFCAGLAATADDADFFGGTAMVLVMPEMSAETQNHSSVLTWSRWQLEKRL